MTRRNKEIILLSLIFVLALSIRLVYCAFVKKYYFFHDYPADDVTYYQDWADKIASGRSPQMVFNGMPLYAYFLAVLKSLTLNHIVVLFSQSW